MSGEFGKIYKRAWGDPDYKALTEGEQALYQKLCSQPDVSLTGVLTYAPQRWAGQTAGLTVEAIERRFQGLVARRYLLWDPDTQEVLIRSYVRNDGGWRSPRTMIGIAGAIRRVLSDQLKWAISKELRRLDIGSLPTKVSDATKRSTRDVVEGLIVDLIGEIRPTDTPSDTPSEGPSDTPSDGVSAVRALNSNSNSNSTSSSTSSSSSSSKSGSARTVNSPDAQNNFEPSYSNSENK